VNIDHHRMMGQRQVLSTLFLHEDIVARTLAYELDLQKWRIAELKAGRSDPGRPTYHEAIDHFNFFNPTSYQRLRFSAVYKPHSIAII
jgi:hypothetical protein